MNIKTFSSSLLIFLTYIYQSQAYRILVIAHTSSRSHYIVGSGIAKALAKAGHDVTIVAPFKSSKPIENLNEIFLDGHLDYMQKHLAHLNLTTLADLSILGQFRSRYTVGNSFTHFSLTHPKFRELLESDQKFDVAVVEIFLSDAFLGVGPHFDVPIVGYSTFGASKWTNDLVGTPAIASYVPNTMYSFTDHMTFSQRFRNLFYYWLEDLLQPALFEPVQQQMYEDVFAGHNESSLTEIKRNISLVLLNTHVSFGFPRPYAPNMIEIGGLHINRNPDPLPSDIQKFLDEATGGAIFFSLGSNVKSSMTSEYKIREIIKAFASFSNHRILFKWEQNILFPSHEVDDVMTKSWYPQEAVLAHPNLKLFITHGGLLSTQESLYFGKPVVGIPIFADQHMNMQFAQSMGFGISVPFGSLTEQKLKSAIKEVLTNPRFRAKAASVSSRYRDQLNTPSEIAVHWIEHVARNKGAPHLRLAAIDLPFYKYYNLDVYAFIGLSVYLVIFVLKKLFVCVCSGRSNSTKSMKFKVQ